MVIFQKVKKSQNGFTVPEMLVALAISSLVMIMIITMYQGQTTSSSAQQEVLNMQQNLRLALYMMERDIMMAGYKVPGQDVTVGITGATATSITISYMDPLRLLDDVDNDLDGAVDEMPVPTLGELGEKDGQDNDCDGEVDEINEVVTVTYRLYDSQGDGDLDLGRQEGCGAIQPVLLNVDQLEFFYQPSAASPGSVGISILARSETPAKGYTDQLTYTPLSGTTVWGPYNDHFRRQLATVTVKCRNL